MLRPALASLLLLLLTLSGCADGGDGAQPTPSTSTTTTATASATSSPAPPSPSASSSPSPTPRPAQTVQKDVRDNSFPEGTFTVQKGDKVVWTHRGSNLHSITTDAGSADAFDSHPNCPPACLLPGGTYEHTFGTVGTVTYFCKVHASMAGTITVVAAA